MAEKDHNNTQKKLKMLKLNNSTMKKTNKGLEKQLKEDTKANEDFAQQLASMEASHQMEEEEEEVQIDSGEDKEVSLKCN